MPIDGEGGIVPPGERASLDDLDNAPSSLPESTTTDYKDLYEHLTSRFQEVSQENVSIKQELEDIRRGRTTIAELDKLIGPSAKAAFRYMSCYSVGAFGLLVADGSGWMGFELDAGVLQLLVGSTAATVLGLVGMVLTGIFVGARKVVNENAREGGDGSR